MKNKILTKLHEIEKEQQIKILYAVESGSRAWGFESQDSDYDIRFIYAHPLKWYLTVEEKRDIIEYPIQDELDFSGWDIKKTLQLYKKSNPPLYEWLVSPIIYIENGNFAQNLRKFMPQFYSPISSTYHYLHMAQGNYRQYLQTDKVRVKKYFYVLRPIFACMWIEQYNFHPPMEFIVMLQKLELGATLKREVENLYNRKKSGEELDKENRIDVINAFLDRKISYFDNYLKEKAPKKNSKAAAVLLDAILQEILIGDLKNTDI